MEKKKNEYKKGMWTAEEDKSLMDYVKIHGKGRWNSISKRTGLKRCGKSCRLRWMNYLNPGIKRARFSEEEEDVIIRLHRLLGNRWRLIAGRMPGRTDNQIKNYWNTHLSKKLGAKKQVSKIAESEANNNSCSCDLGQAPLHSDDEASDRDPARTTVMSPQGYVSNPSLLWVSEFDGLMSESGADPGCFMDLICGNSFNLDWNHL